MRPDGLVDIDWARLVAPQPDGYDTHVIRDLAADCDRRRRSAAAIEWPARLGSSAVAVAPAPRGGLLSDAIVPACVHHPNLAAADRYLRAWPAAHRQLEGLIEVVYPYTDPAQARQGDWSLGSSSHSDDAEWGCLYVTVDDALGLAQGLIHEMAHQKLNAMGVRARSASRFVRNDPSEVYAHPHFGRNRQPMTAILHEQYSFIHVAALNLHILRGVGTERERQRVLMLLSRNINRMEAGHDELMANIRTDASGMSFIDAFDSWSRDVVEAGRSELDRSGYGFDRRLSDPPT